MRLPPSYRASPPVANPTHAFWQSQPDAAISRHQALPELPTEADVVIIGSGLTGALIAHGLLSSDSPERPSSVVILEARTAASGATGRNGGHIKPDCYRGFTSYAALHGPEVARAQCSFEAGNLGDTTAFIKQQGLADEVDLVEYRSADVYLTKKAWQRGLASYNGFKAAGGDVSHLRILDGDEARQLLRVSDCHGAITFPAASLWPYKLAVAVLRLSITLGLQLYTETPVTAVSADVDASGRWKVSTGRGDIRAAKVIHATNGYASHLLPELDGRIIPLKGHVAAIMPPPAFGDTPLTTSFAFISDEDYDYVIQRPGPQKPLIWGSGKIVHPGGLMAGFGDCDDSATSPEVLAHITASPARTLDGWRASSLAQNPDGGDKVPFAWSGVMGLSKDMIPFIGELPGKPGQYLAAGYHGHGMARIFLSTKDFCQRFLGEPVDSRVPAPYFDLERRLKDPIDLDVVEALD